MKGKPQTCISTLLVFKDKFPADWNEGLIIFLQAELEECINKYLPVIFPSELDHIEITKYEDYTEYKDRVEYEKSCIRRVEKLK